VSGLDYVPAKEKASQHLLKASRQTAGETPPQWRSAPNTASTSGIYNQGAGAAVWDVTRLGGALGLNWLDRYLIKTGRADC
jgi:hypothetical protein